jgi:hypothetical protein
MAADWKAWRSRLVDWKEMLESSTSITSITSVEILSYTEDQEVFTPCVFVNRSLDYIGEESSDFFQSFEIASL